MKDKILLIDGHSILNRTFYGVPLLTNEEGLYTNAIYGFVNILLKIIEEENPYAVAVAFDLKAPTFRHIQYKEYKANRKGMPEELRVQVPVMKELLQAMGIPLLEMEGFEADDVIGTIAARCETQEKSVVILSGDRDLLQLATKDTKVRIPKTRGGKTEVEDYFQEDVVEKYGVTPKEFIEMKGLMGDTSDNIPGVPGIGEKTAAKIIQQFQSVENAIQHVDEIKPKRASNNLKEYAEQARMSKKLATICTDCEVEYEIIPFKKEQLTCIEVDHLFRKLEFKSFIQRLGTSSSSDKHQKNDYFDGVEYTYICNEQSLLSFVEQCKKNRAISFLPYIENNHCIGFGVYCLGNMGGWIELNSHLDLEKVMLAFKDIFEDENAEVIMHHSKKVYKLLLQYRIIPKMKTFDTMIGFYLLSPTKEYYDFDDIAHHFLNISLPTEEEILGKGKNKKSILDLEEMQRLEFVIHRAAICFHGKDKIKKSLENQGISELYSEIEFPLIEVLASMELWGLKVDVDKLKEYKSKLEEQLELLRNKIYEEAGEQFNINSPKQLGVILFERLELPVVKKTKTGYSTSVDVLEKLKEKHPIIKNIMEYRQLIKLKTTYADGLEHVVDPATGKIHSNFNQTITATGRISSTEPNLQNIPIKLEMGREIRKIFIPSSEEYVFLDADYSQIELRLLAHLSKDETFITAYKEGKDIHRITASQVFHVPFEDVSSLQRSNAKAVNFGIVYGIGAFSLSQDLGITRKEAEAYIEGYFAKYPDVKKYLDESIESAKINGFAKTIFGRIRPIPELQSKNFNQRSFGERVAMNMPIQGAAADVIKIAMIRVYEELKNRKLRSRLVLQVHDELLLEVHVDELEEVKELLQFEMENAVELQVPLTVDMHSGKNWYETK